jgi:hypothetical protein
MHDAEAVVRRSKARIGELGPVLPGSLGQQWNVCGAPGCRCKDPTHPRRHGPYYQLSDTLQGKSSTVFVKPRDVAEVRRRIKRYGQFQRLCGELVAAYIESLRPRGIHARQPCPTATLG